MAFGKIYFQRVPNFDTPFSLAGQMTETFGLTISHARGEAALMQAQIRAPSGGLLGGPRYAIVAAEKDGQIVELARGEVSGYPIAFSGDLITVDLICRHPDHKSLVDALYSEYDAVISPALEDKHRVRRSEPYIPAYVYHDPVTLVPSLDPIAGSAPPVTTFLGEGAAAGTGDVFDVQLEITDNPVRSSSLTLEADWMQDEWSRVTIDPIDVTGPFATFTPRSFEQVVGQVRFDGGYELIQSSVRFSGLAGSMRVYTASRAVDPVINLVKGASYVDFQAENVSEIEFEILANATQARRETLRVEVAPLISPAMPGDDAESSLALFAPDEIARGIYSISGNIEGPDGRRRPYSIMKKTAPATIFGDNSGSGLRGSLRSSIVYPAIMRAARVAIERAHCVRITIDTTAERAAALTLKDRVRIMDSRLPGGQAVGKVVGLDISFGTSEEGQVVIDCPISDPMAGVPAGDPLEAFDGLSGLAGVYLEGYGASGGPIAQTDATRAVDGADAGDILTYAAIEDAEPVQRQAFDQYTQETPFDGDPAEAMPLTSLSLELMDLSSQTDELTRDLQLAPVVIHLPEGARL